jgi:hypothetical protein
MGFVENAKWHKKEFRKAEIWDKRCTKSLISMAQAISENQISSFSAACGKVLRQCGGRIFSHKNMNPEKMQAGHYKETAKRASMQSIILCPQDTTSINYSGHKATEGLGLIGTKANQKGIMVHTTMALRVDGLPLGIIGQKFWVRNEEDKGKRTKRKLLPIEDKESYKWIDGLEYVNNRLINKAKEIWVISDRESDVYEYMISPRRENVHLLIRAMHPRIVEAELGGKMQRMNLTELVKILPKAATKEVEIERENRTIKINLSISYSNINLIPPMSKGKAVQPLEMMVIYAEEIGLEGKADKIEWTLLCDKQNLTTEEALQMLEYYTQRWKIERLHYTLKTGAFNVEKLQFDDARTLMNALAFYSVIAWHTLWLMYYSRLEPEAKAEAVIDQLEKEILEASTGKKIETVLESVMAIGILGGFLGGSKRYPFPGIKTIWIGIIKLIAMKEGWLLANSHFLKKYAT